MDVRDRGVVPQGNRVGRGNRVMEMLSILTVGGRMNLHM